MKKEKMKGKITDIYNDNPSIFNIGGFHGIHCGYINPYNYEISLENGCTCLIRSFDALDSYKSKEEKINVGDDVNLDIIEKKFLKIFPYKELEIKCKGNLYKNTSFFFSDKKTKGNKK